MDGKILQVVMAIVLACAPALCQTRTVIVDKPNLQLYLLEDGDTLFSAPVCVGANYGNKVKKGDHKTPEGTFTISQIQDSSKWRTNYGGRKGVKHVYGPWFLRLKAGKWTTIGIHGTCFPKSIGTRASGGCIRMLNKDIVTLKSYVEVGTTVIILPDSI